MQLDAVTNLLDESFLIATFAQAILYGLYIVTLAYSLRSLICEDDDGWTLRSRDNVNWLILSVTVLISAFSSVDLGITLKTTLALVKADRLDSNKFGVISINVEVITILITDAVLVFRCWQVYAKSWRIVTLPIILWFSCCASLILFDYWLITDVHDLSIMSVLTPKTRSVATVFFSGTLTNNIYVTLAISHRILRHAKNSTSGYFYIICRIFAESGIICASTSIAMVVTSSLLDSRSLPAIFMDAMNFSATGIAFNLILLRLGRLRTRETRNKQGICEVRSEEY